MTTQRQAAAAETIKQLTDDALQHNLKQLVASLRATEAEVVVYLAEVISRQLYAQAGYSSLFAFCTQALGFSEGTACRRMAAARVATRLPAVLEMLRSGRLHCATLAMLEKHLTADNAATVLMRAAGRNKRELEWLLAELAPQPDVVSSIRKQPAAREAAGDINARGVFSARAAEPAAAGPAGARSTIAAREDLREPAAAAKTPAAVAAAATTATAAVVATTAAAAATTATAAAVATTAAEATTAAAAAAANSSAATEANSCTTGEKRSSAKLKDAKVLPLSSERVLVKFSASRELEAKVRRAQDLLAHKYPRGELEEVFGEALEVLIERLDPARRLARKSLREERRRQATERKTAKETEKKAKRLVEKMGVAAADKKPEMAELSSSRADSPEPEVASGNRIRSRYIPAEIRLAAWTEADGRCTYTSPDGRRCAETRQLELDHCEPWAIGGEHCLGNLRVYCRSHNRYAARQTFGPWDAPRSPARQTTTESPPPRR